MAPVRWWNLLHRPRLRLPRCPVHHCHQDGCMNFTGPRSLPMDADYEPNSFGDARQDASPRERDIEHTA